MYKHEFVQIPALTVSSIHFSKFTQPGLSKPINFEPVKKKCGMNTPNLKEISTENKDNEKNDKSKQKVYENFDDQTKAVDALKQEKDEQRKLEKIASQGEIVSKDESNSYSDDD